MTPLRRSTGRSWRTIPAESIDGWRTSLETELAAGVLSLHRRAGDNALIVRVGRNLGGEACCSEHLISERSWRCANCGRMTGPLAWASATIRERDSRSGKNLQVPEPAEFAAAAARNLDQLLTPGHEEAIRELGDAADTEEWIINQAAAGCEIEGAPVLFAQRPRNREPWVPTLLIGPEAGVVEAGCWDPDPGTGEAVNGTVWLSGPAVTEVSPAALALAHLGRPSLQAVRDVNPARTITPEPLEVAWRTRLVGGHSPLPGWLIAPEAINELNACDLGEDLGAGL